MVKNKQKTRKPFIGFIGQGYIGKNYANDFEKRGFKVVRYAAEKEFVSNKEKIKTCDIVFIAVPTPTTPKGFDGSIVRDVVSLVGQGKIAVIKSTVLPETTKRLQKENPKIIILHSPEFLSSATAGYDAGHPTRNIIGIPNTTPKFKNAAKLVLSVLPKAPFSLIMSSSESELVKYAGNCFYYLKVVYVNILYDLSKNLGVPWEHIRNAMAHDPWIGGMHLEPVYKGGRGAGGHCFIKDFKAFSDFYKKELNDKIGTGLLQAVEAKNLDLLKQSHKNLDILKGVYGDIV